MNTKSRDAYKSFVSGTSRAARSRASLLAQMARDAEESTARAERLRGLREQARVSQVTAANAIGVTPRAYQEWEYGGDMDPENRRKAAAYFGTTEDFIEFGVIERRRRKAPTVRGREQGDELAKLRDQLNRIEEMLRQALSLPAPPRAAATPPGALGRDATNSPPTPQDTGQAPNRKGAGRRRGAGR